MKKFFTIIFLLLLTKTDVFSQINRTPEIFIGTGTSMLSSPETLSNSYNSGFNFGISLGLPLNDVLSVKGTFNYGDYDLNEISILHNARITARGLHVLGDNATLLTFSGNMKIFLGKGVPYFLGGIGYYKLSFDDLYIGYMGEEEEQSEKEIDGINKSIWGVLLGFGKEFSLTEKFGFFVDGTYNIILNTEKINYLAIIAGVMFKL